jgi:hypothetical protein
MSTPIDITGFLELQTWQESVILLEPEHFDRALELSRLTSHEAHQWRTYINGLALCGFIEWLRERTVDLPIQQDACSLLQPEYASVLNAICHLRVGRFTLCLIVTESVTPEWVAVPRVVVELPEFAADLYVLLEVQEEQAQIILRGCLRYDHLLHHRQSTPLLMQPDWTYQFPLHWFDPDSNHLLLYLRFLNPETLARPAISPQITPTHKQAQLWSRLPQLRADLSANIDLWEILTWEQGITVLTSPSLLRALYQDSANLESSPVDPTSLIERQLPPGQPLINVWNWLQNLLDVTTRTLAWSIPQSLTPASAMRRSLTKVESAIQDLIQRQDIDTRQQVHYAYTTLEGTPFQFCAVTWLIPTDQPVQEWALLLILVAQPGKVLPVGTRLQVRATTLLADVVLETTDLYLYVLVEGNQSETFTPTILPPDAAPVILPAFICHPTP